MKWYFCLTDACLKPVFQIHLNHNSLQPLFLDHTVLADVEGVAVVWVTAQSCKTVTDLTKLDEKKLFFFFKCSLGELVSQFSPSKNQHFCNSVN